MPGKYKIVPRMGIRLKKSIATGKNPLKSTKKPYISKIIPIMGHPKRTITIPPKKARVPLTLCLWKKNLNVLSNPITLAKPQINRILPIAKRPLSKSKITPRNKKKMPKAAKPTPIFCVSDISNMV